MIPSHLINNALAYSNASDPIAIRIVESGERFLEVRFEDRGTGIPADDLPKVFDKFFRCDLHRNSDASGSGLGLFISKSYAGIMGGSLRLESETGRGTTVILRLPKAHGSKGVE